MPLFTLENQKLNKLHIAPLSRERDLQRLLEANLPEALGVYFLATEYTTTMGGRIDTLAVDEAGSPVIIEYKKNRNDNVINQALSYLRWLKTQKREFFEKLMIDRLGSEIQGRLKLDWANPRVICIAETYSKFDIDTVEVVPLRIELLRYRFYGDSLFSLEPVTIQPEDVERSTPVAGTSADVVKPAPTVELRSAGANSAISAVFEDLREWLFKLDEAVVEKPTSFYVAYRLTKNFAEVHVTQRALKIHLRPIAYDDPLGKVERVPASYNWTMDRRIYVRGPEDLEWAQALIEQSYRDVL